MNTILIVEDEMPIRKVFARLLSAEGYVIFEAENAIVARDILWDKKIDLLLLDINMAEVSGDEFYPIVKLFHTHTKIIVTSVYPLEEQHRLIPGACDYFDKSEGLAALLEKIGKTGHIKLDVTFQFRFGEHAHIAVIGFVILDKFR